MANATSSAARSWVNGVKHRIVGVMPPNFATGRVAVINENMANRIWPGQEAIGKRFSFGYATDTAQRWITVVGVAADVKDRQLSSPARLSVLHAISPRRLEHRGGDRSDSRRTNDRDVDGFEYFENDRSADAGVSCHELGRDDAAVVLAAGSLWEDVWHRRGDCRRSCGGRCLRRDLLRRRPAHAGDRGPRRPWRAEDRRAPTHRRTWRAARWTRRRRSDSSER